MRTHSAPPLDLGELRGSNQEREREHKESIDKRAAAGRLRSRAAAAGAAGNAMRRCTSNAGRCLALLPFPPSHPVSGAIITGAVQGCVGCMVTSAGADRMVAPLRAGWFRGRSGGERSRGRRGDGHGGGRLCVARG
jgi:hypothetical protein